MPASNQIPPDSTTLRTPWDRGSPPLGYIFYSRIGYHHGYRSMELLSSNPWANEETFTFLRKHCVNVSMFVHLRKNSYGNKICFPGNKNVSQQIQKHFCRDVCRAMFKAGESRGRAPGQASDYALRAPNPLDSSPMTRCFIKISGPPNQSGPQVFCPPLPPLSPALAMFQVFPGQETLLSRLGRLKHCFKTIV